jgi:hypothetical protein
VLTANQKCAKLLMDVMDELFEKDNATPKLSCLAVNDPCNSCVEGKVFAQLQVEEVEPVRKDPV